MNENTPTSPRETQPAFTDEDIRDYAFHLYQQSGCVPGHDLENWLEAKACLEANIAKDQSQSRLHRQRHPEAYEVLTVLTIETESSSPLNLLEAPAEVVDTDGFYVLATRV